MLQNCTASKSERVEIDKKAIFFVALEFAVVLLKTKADSVDG